MQSLRKVSIKMYEELRSQGTHCLYIFIESEVKKMIKVHIVEKVTKIKAKIISKPQAHLQTMEKTCAKFQMIGIKLYEELRSQYTHCLYNEVEK